jgi:hypothetical protein
VTKEKQIEGYVLVQTELGRAAAVAAAAGRLEGVMGVDVLTGPYDLLVSVVGLHGCSADVLSALASLEDVLRVHACFPRSIAAARGEDHRVFGGGRTWARVAIS